jgi:hypothetical protein
MKALEQVQGTGLLSLSMMHAVDRDVRMIILI